MFISFIHFYKKWSKNQPLGKVEPNQPLGKVEPNQPLGKVSGSSSNKIEKKELAKNKQL
jgi:hypothetical protein